MITMSHLCTVCQSVVSIPCHIDSVSTRYNMINCCCCYWDWMPTCRWLDRPSLYHFNPTEYCEFTSIAKGRRSQTCNSPPITTHAVAGWLYTHYCTLCCTHTTRTHTHLVDSIESWLVWQGTHLSITWHDVILRARVFTSLVGLPITVLS